MEQLLTNFISLYLDLPYVGVVTHETRQKGVADYLQNNLHPLRLLGLATP